MKKEKKILFITRTYPPVIGGMEKYSHDLYNSIKTKTNINLVANKKGKKNLPIFFIKATLYILKNKKKYTHIHFGDGVLGPLAYFSKLTTKAKTSITIHALDITYKNKIYQKIIPFCISKLDNIVCVSNYTINECVKRKIPKKKCIFIPNGINTNKIEKCTLNLEHIEKKYNLNLKNKTILFSIGRLIKRKGTRWFISEVMPKLDKKKYIYLIGGSGPEEKNIIKQIKTSNLEKNVFLLGRISDKERNCLFKHSSFFIMPNIKIKGDAEGFGIVLIEAGSYGLTSIGSNIEGISDAIINEKTGYLVKSKNIKEFINKINNNKINKKNIKQHVRKNFDWNVLSDKYINKVFK